MKIKIAPSVLAADFLHLGDEIARADASGADILHCDVMDGVYVPNISFGFSLLEPMAEATALPMDVHMMTVGPDRYVDRLHKIGASCVTVHSDAMDTERIAYTLRSVREAGMKASVSLSPRREAEELLPLLPYVDMVLVMTVEPGFGGQVFMPEMLPKIRAVRELLNREKPECDLEVDGGIDADTIREAASAGANVFVVGTSSFRSADMAASIASLRAAAEKAYQG